MSVILVFPATSQPMARSQTSIGIIGNRNRGADPCVGGVGDGPLCIKNWDVLNPETSRESPP